MRKLIFGADLLIWWLAPALFEGIKLDMYSTVTKEAVKTIPDFKELLSYLIIFDASLFVPSLDLNWHNMDL